MPKLNRCPIILASSSPRRRELLTEAGYEFTCVVPEINESALSPVGVIGCDYAKQLALIKAKCVAEKNPDSLVIGADTIVDFAGEIIGKAANAKHAEQIIRKLFSAPHKVITAVAILSLSNGIALCESDTTVVYPRCLTEQQIDEHIKSGAWQGKAGAYAIMEKGDEFIEKIEGSLTNIMGLPMEHLQRMLKRFIE